MTPVDQTILETDDSLIQNNSFTACCASFVDSPLWMIPPFHLMGDRAHKRIIAWFAKLDYEVIFLQTLVKQYMFSEERRLLRNLPKYYFVEGVAEHSRRHWCIYSDGKLLHDPHPSKKGLLREVSYLVPLSKEFAIPEKRPESIIANLIEAKPEVEASDESLE